MAFLPDTQNFSYRFPSEMGNSPRNLPFVKFHFHKFRNETIHLEMQGPFQPGQGPKPPTKVPLGNIYLPLPDGMQNSYSLNWEMADLKAISAGVGFLNSGDFGKLGSDLAAILFDKYAKIFTNQAPNPKKQALFNGIEPRTFSLNYTFSPQSLQEAEQVERIVKTFVTHSLPSLATENEAFYQFPAEYEISFLQGTGEASTALLPGYPTISSCVCTSVSTSPTPNAVQLLQSGHAVQTSLSLTFLETELLRQEKPGL